MSGRTRIGTIALSALLFSAALSDGALSAPLYSIQTIDVPGALRTEARGINNHGHVVGSFEAVDGSVHGFFYDGTAYHTLSYPGAVQTDANGINDAGQIVGSYFLGSGQSPSGGGFLFDSKGYQSVLGPAGASAGLVDINNVGTILGRSGAQYATSAFLLSHGEYTAISTPGARETVPTGLTDTGKVVGITYFGPVPGPNDGMPGGADIRGFVFDAGTLDVVSLDSQTRLYAINNLNKILGDFSGSSFDPMPSGHRFQQDLGSAVVEYLDHVQGTLEDINDFQQIAGSYGDGKTMHGYIATPVPEPDCISLLTVGSSLVFLRPCRRTVRRWPAAPDDQISLTLRPLANSLQLKSGYAVRAEVCRG